MSAYTYRLRPLLELGGQSTDIDEVWGEGRVVVGEVPLPAGAALVVVAEHPAQPTHVLQRHAVPNRTRSTLLELEYNNSEK